ncbi:MAG: hypothetical protein Q6K70_08565 [Thermostichales cyanobacterium DRC_bins_46]
MKQGIARSILAAVGLLTLAGCSQDGYMARIQMTASPTGIPGQFVVSGVTTLPPKSILVVDALRYLEYPRHILPEQPVFAVLDRQETLIGKDYRWQVVLNTAPGGKEVWQRRYQDVKPPVQPLGEDIVFRATWLPDSQPQAIQDMIGGQGQQLRGLQLLHTGRMQYVRAYFPLAAPVPDQMPTPTPTPDPMMKWRLKNDPIIYRWHHHY